MNKKRCLITGGCGFIGSNLAHSLVQKGWSVTIVDDMSNGSLENLEGLNLRVIPGGSFVKDFMTQTFGALNDVDVIVIQEDLADESVLGLIRSKAYDLVFHQAAIPRVSYSVENPAETTYANIASVVSLLEACAGNVERVILASSSSVYGGPEDLPIVETCLKNPKSPYAWQKSAIEDYCKLYSDLYDTDTVCLRYFNVFGPNQMGDSPYSTAISAWCNAIAEGTRLRSDGDGSQSRDLTYVDNVVQANILSATYDGKFNGECFNVGCGERWSNNDVLNYLKENYPGIEVYNAPWRPGDVMHTKADITKISKWLGYKPEVTFWDGLKRTIDWWGLDED